MTDTLFLRVLVLELHNINNSQQNKLLQ